VALALGGDLSHEMAVTKYRGRHARAIAPTSCIRIRLRWSETTFACPQQELLGLGNLEMLSSLFFDGAELEAVPFGRLERKSLERLLPQFEVFEECDELDVTKITEKIISFVLV
jgi:hypothetical protein